MPATRYKLWAVGTPLNDGATGAIHVGISGIAKKATAASPFIVANELMCNGLARALLLPCPPGALLDHSGEPHFFSLNFNLAGQALPPIPAANVVGEQPRKCWEIIAFDALIMNGDRHPRNMAYDATTKKLQIFDHSHALLGSEADFDARLAQTRNGLAIGGHCLASVITTTDGMKLATDRICALPNYLIEGLVEASCSVGIPAAKRTEFADFLKHRRDNLVGLLNSNMASFPKLAQGGP